MTTHQHLNVIIGKYVNVLQSYDPEWPQKKKRSINAASSRHQNFPDKLILLQILTSLFIWNQKKLLSKYCNTKLLSIVTLFAA